MTVPVGLSASPDGVAPLVHENHHGLRAAPGRERAQTHPTLRFKRLGARVGFRRGVAAFGKGTTLPRRPRLAAKPHAGAGTGILG